MHWRWEIVGGGCGGVVKDNDNDAGNRNAEEKNPDCAGGERRAGSALSLSSFPPNNILCNESCP